MYHLTMNIYLIRHGEAAANWQDATDPGLSKLGRNQAELAAAELAPRLAPATRIISSPMQRAKETADPLCELAGRDYDIVDDFREIPSPVPVAQRREWLGNMISQRWDQQHGMVLDWRRTILGQLDGLHEPTVIFTHFMVLNVIVGAVTSSDKIVSFRPDNASVTELRREGSGLRLLQLGRELETVVN